MPFSFIDLLSVYQPALLETKREKNAPALVLLNLNLGNWKVGRLKIQMGVSKNSATPKWMVINPINIDDMGVPLFLETSK